MTFVKERVMSAEKEPVVESAEKPKRVVKLPSRIRFSLFQSTTALSISSITLRSGNPVEVEMHPWLEAQVEALVC